MSTLIEHLRSFNRKERFILLRRTLGRDTFQLDGSFRERLGQELGVKGVDVQRLCQWLLCQANSYPVR